MCPAQEDGNLFLKLASRANRTPDGRVGSCLFRRPTPGLASAPALIRRSGADGGTRRGTSLQKNAQEAMGPISDARPVADVHRRHRAVRREDAVAQYDALISRR